MAKKFTNTRCVYCLRYFKELTSDHVFPKSWYPETTPENLRKIQVPACDECNQKFSKIENELLLKFGLCLNPKELKSLGIGDKVLRSLRASCAKNEADQTHRRKRLEKVVRHIVPPENIKQESILPNFGPWPGMLPDEQIGILISHEKLILLGEKFVRGITYDNYAKYIDKNYKVEVFFAHNKNARPIVDNLKRFGKHDFYGPGINIHFGFAHDDPQSGLFAFEFWGKFCMYASVLPKKEAKPKE